MDLSSLPEDQRQQLQQLQLQFQEHQRQQQLQQQQQQHQHQHQQIQDYSSQPYDPFQLQSYDQSYYSYYQYQDPQHSQQQHYAYYQTDYANAYQQQPQPPPQPQPQPQPQLQPQQPQYLQLESAPIHPPGVSVPHEAPPPQAGESGGAAVGSGQGQVQVQHQQVTYHSQQAGTGGNKQISGYGVPPVLNQAAAAAVAALSQLTQFAGTMDAAERAMAGLQERQWHARGGGYGPSMGPGPGPFLGPGPMHHAQGPMRPRVGQSPYKGGGRRGGGQFKRSGQGNFGNRPPRSGGSGPPFRGKGRGRGRGGPKRFLSHGASSSSHTEPSAADEVETEEEAEPSADEQEEMLQAVVPSKTSAPTQGSATLNGQPPRVAWCELCRVDCTSLEILEQHKNGKRHRKNLQRFEKLKNAHKTATKIQGEQEPVSDSSHEVDLKPENIQAGEENKQTCLENFPDQAVSDENKVGMEQQNDQAKEQSNMQTKRPWTNRFDNQRHGIKRKMRGGRGGKRLRTFDTPRWPVEPPKPKVVIPLICDLCNVKCDTQEVFDRHLSGKKHISKLKRYEGHQAMYGPMGLQALYPPNPIAQTLFLPPGPQATYGPRGSYPPPGAYMPPQAHHTAVSTAGTGSEFQQYIEPQTPNAISEFDCKNAVPGAQQQRALVEPGDTTDAS